MSKGLSTDVKKCWPKANITSMFASTVLFTECQIQLFHWTFPAMGTQRCCVGCWRRQISCSSLYSGDVVGSILHDVYKTPYWLKRWPRLWRSGFWTTKLINFRTVLMVPCKLTTWKYGFSEGRKFVGWRVNKERRVREAIEMFSGSNIERGGQFWTSRDLPGCFVTWFTI